MNIRNTEERPKFNIADAVIIIAMIVVIAAISLRVYNIFSVDKTPENVIVEFEITNISSDSIGINKNDKLYSAADNSEVGYIIDFEVSDMTQYAYNENGELVKAAVPGKSTVKGTMLLSGKTNEKGFLLGGTTLLTESQELSLYTMSRDFTVKIVKIGK
ncbi:MAG: DUF4330 family protein [Eubacteriales bacterium]